MTNSSSKAPASARSGNAYTRFIPAEELSHFAAWQPGTIEGAGQARTTDSAESAESATRRPAAAAATDGVAELARARREGAQEGYQNGYRDGLVALESFKQSLAMQSTTQLAALMKNLESAYDALQPQLADAVAQVAVDLARQVLKSEIVTRPEVVAEVATQALAAMLLSARHITVAVHPLDVPCVQAAAADALRARDARVVANPTLKRCDVMVHSDIGTIDARVSTRWLQATAHLGQQTAPASEVQAP